MNILIVVGRLSFGGVSVVLTNMVNAIQRPDLTFDICSILPGSPHMEKQIKCGIKVLFQENAFMNIRFLKLLPGLLWNGILRTADYDKIVLYGAEAILWCGYCMPKGKTTCWVHDNPEFADGRNFSRYHTIRSKLTMVRKRKAYERAQRIVCVSSQCERIFAEIWGYKEKLLTLNNIIDIDRIRRKSRAYTPDFDRETINLVSVGRLSYEKAYDRIIEAVKQAVKKGMAVCAYLIGEGEKRTELLELIKQYHLEKNVILAGAKENPYPYIMNADCLVISSISEAYSTVAVEAQILGIPVLTTDCCGMRDIFSNDESSVICPNAQVAFTEALISFIEPYSLSARKQKAKEQSIALSMNTAQVKIENFLLSNWK